MHHKNRMLGNFQFEYLKIDDSERLQNTVLNNVVKVRFVKKIKQNSNFLKSFTQYL